MQNGQKLTMFAISLVSVLVVGLCQQGFAFSQICINSYSGCIHTVASPDRNDPPEVIEPETKNSEKIT